MIATRRHDRLASLSLTCGVTGLALGLFGYWLAATSMSGSGVVAPIGMVGSVLGGIPAMVFGLLSFKWSKGGARARARGGLLLGLVCMVFPFVIPTQ